jgi:uncharacterized protein
MSGNIRDEKVVEKIGEALKDNAKVILAFLFGSAVSGRLLDESDVDVAVLFDHMPEISDILNLKAAVSEATNRDVDLVILNDSSPIICMQVLKSGILIRKRDNTAYSNFCVKTVKQYDDLKYIRKEAESDIMKGKIYA